MHPRLSIIMTAYNSEKFIRRAITSVLNQSFSNFELLLINDASQDATLEIMLSVRDARIRIFDNPINSGTYFSRNIGLFHSRGDCIAFVDSDDLISPNRFMRIMDIMTENRDIVHLETNYMRFYESTKKIWFREWTRGVGVAVIRRKVIQDIGYFMPVSVSGDLEYANRIREFYGKERFFYLPDFTYWASKRANSLTSLATNHIAAERELINYSKEVFYLKGNLYVAFPYEQELLEAFSRLEYFAGIELDREKKLRIIAPKIDEEIAPNMEQLALILDFSEQCMVQFYSNYVANEKELGSFFSKKRFRKKINRLKKWLFDRFNAE